MNRASAWWAFVLFTLAASGCTLALEGADLEAALACPSAKPVCVGDGRQARLEPLGQWNFLAWPYNAVWRSGDDHWDPQHAIDQCEAVHAAPLTLEPLHDSEDRMIVASERRTIVCIDPVVVVLTPAEMPKWTVSPTQTDEPAPPELAAAWEDQFLRLLGLPWVYEYGTEAPLGRGHVVVLPHP